MVMLRLTVSQRTAVAALAAPPMRQSSDYECHLDRTR